MWARFYNISATSNTLFIFHNGLHCCSSLGFKKWSPSIHPWTCCDPFYCFIWYCSKFTIILIVWSLATPVQRRTHLIVFWMPLPFEGLMRGHPVHRHKQAGASHTKKPSTFFHYLYRPLPQSVKFIKDLLRKIQSKHRGARRAAPLFQWHGTALAGVSETCFIMHARISGGRTKQQWREGGRATCLFSGWFRGWEVNEW